MSKDRDTENIRLKIRSWLIEQGYSIQPKDDPASKWGLIALEYGKQEFGFFVGVFSPHTIQLALTLPVDDFQAKLDALPAQARHEFLYDLRIALIAFDVNFNIPNGSFSELEFGTGVFVEGLTRAGFFQAVGELRKAILLTAMMLERKFGPGISPVQFSGRIH